MLRRKRPYTDTDLNNAIEAVQTKRLNLSQACKKYDIPISSLHLVMKRMKSEKNLSRFYYCLI